MRPYPFHRASVLILSSCLIAVAPAMADSPPLPNAALFVGNGAGCDFDTVQQAVDFAALQPGGDLIVLANDQTYLAQQIRVEDTESLVLQGGANGCPGIPADGAFTVLSGAGGAAAPVITHIGHALLGLRGLELRDGDAGDAGGGLDSRGGGDLRLHDVRFVSNRAAIGGGVNALGGTGEIDLKHIRLVGHVEFRDNEADVGGGMFAVYARIVPENGATLSVISNDARTGDGGGWLLWNSTLETPSDAERFGCQVSFTDNKAAIRGGAVYLYGVGQEARLENRLAPGCISFFLRNSAGVAGGAVYALAEGDPASASSSVAAMYLQDTRLNHNRAPDGAAISMRTVTASLPSPMPAAYLVLGRRSHAAAAVTACDGASVVECAGASQNSSESANGVPSTGATIAVQADPGAPVEVEANRAVFVANDGGEIIRLSGAAASLRLRNSLAAHGRLQRVLSADADASIVVGRSTLVFGTFASPPGTAVMLGDRRFLLEGSLVDFASRDFLRMRRSVNEAQVREVLIRDQNIVLSADNPPANVASVYRATDFRYADYESGNMRPLPGSPAIDRYDQADLDLESEPDLDLRPRGYDDPAVPNAPGAVYDLGAYEQANGIFANGFE